ncbi:dihydroorotase [Spirulina major]|uniref:dihydroorotase n=1 Tax=Spirulina major TaxID=270636 RepID=UPI0009342A04|nr:dihydroorotase [Spirulina major]
MTELIKQVRVLDPESETDIVADVRLDSGQIAAIAPQLSDRSEDLTITDGQGQILAPGLVDLYSSSDEPGYEDRETLASLTAAAAAGGFTRLALLPNTNPPLDNLPSVQTQQRRYSGLPVRCATWGAITPQLAGKGMVEYQELAPQVVGFSDGTAMPPLDLLRRILEYLQPLGKPIAIAPVLPQLRGNGVMREGDWSIQLGLPGDPSYSETAALAALLELVAAVPTPIHLMRISTAKSVDLIATAKAQGLPITASTTWLHLLYDTRALTSYDPTLHLATPLGNPADCEALRAGVKAGVIDAIAVDHTPISYEDKTVSFAESPPGAIGLQTALPCLWQQLVISGHLTALELWNAISTQPARCLRQAPPRCAVGAAAELTLFDPQRVWTADAPGLRSLSTNSPLFEQQIVGQVVTTYSQHHNQIV